MEKGTFSVLTNSIKQLDRSLANQSKMVLMATVAIVVCGVLAVISIIAAACYFNERRKYLELLQVHNQSEGLIEAVGRYSSFLRDDDSYLVEQNNKAGAYKEHCGGDHGDIDSRISLYPFVFYLQFAF